MVKEVHEVSETLVKIRAGTLSHLELDSGHPEIFTGHNDYHEYDEEDEYYGEEDFHEYGLEDHKYIQKNLSKKNCKVTSKQMSSVITAQVKKTKM
jgi:hypothetical protein